jgi:hypothetical protein
MLADPHVVQLVSHQRPSAQNISSAIYLDHKVPSSVTVMMDLEAFHTLIGKILTPSLISPTCTRCLCW